MTHRLNTTAFRPLRNLLALAAAAVAFSAHAVPVTVSIAGLPSGLSPVVDIQRNVCPDGMGWFSNAPLKLVESSQTVFEQVTMPTGQVLLRSKIVTRYSGSIDTPPTPTLAARTQPWDIRCSEVFISGDHFQLFLKIPGVDANAQATSTVTWLGTFPQNAPINVAPPALSARTTSFTPALNVITRSVATTVEGRYTASIGNITGQRLEFLRPSTLIPGTFSRVASIFFRSPDNAACVQAGATTRCMSGATPVDAGGVRLRNLTRTATGATQFQFELMPTFPVGTLKLRATADASDLAEYIVDGTPQVLDLLPVVPMEQTVTVQ